MHGRRAGKIGALNSIKLKKHHVKGWRPFQGGALLIGTGHNKVAGVKIYAAVGVASAGMHLVTM